MMIQVKYNFDSAFINNGLKFEANKTKIQNEQFYESN